MTALRIGQGYDVHALVAGRPLIIGGVTIPFDRGLLGHSDADVLLHAVTDALLGAAALGDIGRHFPDTDDQFHGADSRVLLREAARRVREAGFSIVNVDTTVIAQKPKLAPAPKDTKVSDLMEALRASLAGANAPPARKATGRPPAAKATTARRKPATRRKAS